MFYYIIMINQSGGKIIGSGSYGCVYKPVIPCNNGRELPPNQISKLLKSSHALTELNSMTRIDEIDPTHIFHLPKGILCSLPTRPPHPKSLADYASVGSYGNHLSRCGIIRPNSNLTQYSLLQSYYGGIDLNKFYRDGTIRDDDRNIKKFLHRIAPLLYGLYIMKKNDYVHNDIKAGNMLIDKNTYVMNFIDFGLSIKAQNYSMWRDKDNLNRGYFIYPLETAYLVNDRLRRNLRYSKASIEASNQDKALRVLDGKGFTDNLLKQIYQIIDVEPYRTMDDVEKRLELLKRADTFSLGIVFLMALGIIIGNPSKIEIDFDTDLDVIPDVFTGQISRKEIEIQRLLTNFYKLIKMMLHPYYNSRATPSQLLNFYTDNIYLNMYNNMSHFTKGSLEEQRIKQSNISKYMRGLLERPVAGAGAGAPALRARPVAPVRAPPVAVQAPALRARPVAPVRAPPVAVQAPALRARPVAPVRAPPVAVQAPALRARPVAPPRVQSVAPPRVQPVAVPTAPPARPVAPALRARPVAPALRARPVAVPTAPAPAVVPQPRVPQAGPYASLASGMWTAPPVAPTGNIELLPMNGPFTTAPVPPAPAAEKGFFEKILDGARTLKYYAGKGGRRRNLKKSKKSRKSKHKNTKKRSRK